MEAYNGPFCQSCGMPMKSPDVHGTEADGTPSADYCTYCYQQGSFVDPSITMEEMAEFCAKAMAEMEIISYQEAKNLMDSFLPMLKRWRM